MSSFGRFAKMAGLLLGTAVLGCYAINHLLARRVPAPGPEEALDPVDEASRDSFPASDAPAWTGLVVS